MKLNIKELGTDELFGQIDSRKKLNFDVPIPREGEWINLDNKKVVIVSKVLHNYINDDIIIDVFVKDA